MPILNKDKIPKELWSKRIIHMPSHLVEAYRYFLSLYKILDLAESMEDRPGPVGGFSEKDTLEHFALRYGVSACRLESIVIDPENAFTSISNDLLVTFSGERVAILDAPCGTGAAGASIISTIAVLRKTHILPTLPLNIFITAGDFSQKALDIYAQIIVMLEPYLRSVGININFSNMIWDGTKPDKTAALIDRWFSNSVDCEEYLSVIANFSSAASTSFTDFQRSFEHIHERLHDKTASVIWVEPKMKGAEKYLKKISNLMKLSLPWISTSNYETLDYEYRWFNPIQNRPLPCKIQVQRYSRN